MNYIVCLDKTPFEAIGDYNYCSLEDMVLTDIISVDTETTGLQARNCDIFCTQIGTGKNNYIIVMYNNNYKFQDLIPYLKNKTMIFHNALFDLGFFYKYGFYPENVRDTMLASKVLYNGAEDSNNYFLPYRHDFGAVMKRELNVQYDKTDQKNIHIVKLSQQSTIEYSFNDVDRLVELHEVLSLKIDQRGYRKTYDLHCNYIRALAYMEQCGLPISSKMWKDKMIKDINNSFEGKTLIENYIYDNLPKYRDGQLDMFNDNKKINVSINSPLQMIKVFNDFGINTKDKDGKDSINEKVISKSKHEFVKMWLDYQEANHRVTTFGDKIYQQIEEERIYTNFNPMVDTARLSSRKGSINFLNFPSDSITRDCFQANDGNVLIVCDYGAQEGVLLADQSKDEAMTASVLEGADLHSLLTKKIHPKLAHLSDEDVAKLHKDKRTQAKISRFALSFGGSAYTLHINQNIPMEEAYVIENSFKDLHKGMYDWGEKNFHLAVKKGYVESADGWKLHLPKFSQYLDLEKKVKNITREQWQSYKIGKSEYKKYWEAKEKKEAYIIKNEEEYNYYKSKKTEVSTFFKLQSEYKRICLNNPIQSSAAHMTKYATLLIFNWILSKGYINVVKIVNVIHDECVVECPENIKNEVCKAVENCMIEAGNHYLKDLTIKADANIGKSWYEAK
jgi:DNA polymerase I